MHAFQIGDLTVNRDATLTAPDGENLSDLLEALKAKGYELAGNDKSEPEAVTEQNTEQESTAAEETSEQNARDLSESDKPESDDSTETETADTTEDGITEFTISLPLASANAGTLMNLISSKKSLIEKALGVTDTRINITEDKIEFPWFNRELTPEEVHAYTRFLSFLCKLSNEIKRCSGIEHPADNEKYTFRCFLLRLGFIGAEYKEDRKILLQNLTGSAAFRNGVPAKSKTKNEEVAE